MTYQPADFYPRSPCGERPFFLFFVYILFVYFYPRSPCGERLVILRKRDTPSQFLSTLSLRRATCDTLSALAPEEFLSTLSLRRATRGGVACYLDNIISIHALLAESDASTPTTVLTLICISIHALLAESDWRGWIVC